jgi:hypothetical protein
VGSAGSLGEGSAGGGVCGTGASWAIGFAQETDRPRPEGAISEAASRAAAEISRVGSEMFALHRTNRVMRDSETLP